MDRPFSTLPTPGPKSEIKTTHKQKTVRLTMCLATARSSSWPDLARGIISNQFSAGRIQDKEHSDGSGFTRLASPATTRVAPLSLRFPAQKATKVSG